MKVITEIMNQVFYSDQGRVLTGSSTPGVGIYEGNDPLTSSLSLFFVQATIIIGLCRVLGLAGKWLKQPSVIFEVVAGICIGPSWLLKDDRFHNYVFPAASLSNLQIVASIGLTFYLFIVGMELDIKMLKTHFKKTTLISLFGIAVPFCVGIGVSSLLKDILQPESTVSTSSFFVFIGTAMSITAFPVLARLLKEGGFIYTHPGSMALGAAAVDDAIAWTLLALAISIAQGGDMRQASYIFATVVAFAIFLLSVIKPCLEYVVEYGEVNNITWITNNLFALTICLLMMCAWFTELIGLDSIFGAFLFGLCIPRGTKLHHQCNEYIETYVLTFTLPLYFALSGIKTDITTITTSTQGGMVVLVTVLAIVSKVIGCGTACLFSGLNLRESAVVGTFMNCKGLVELIVLNVGLSSNILTTKTFSVMVLMAIATTFITSPIVEFLYPPHMRQLEALEQQHRKEIELVSIESNSHNGNEIDLKTLPNRIGIIIEDLQQMQDFVNMLRYFLPYEHGAELATTLMHFYQPTNTRKDSFIGLNEQGRLIRVDEEPTDIATALRLTHSDASVPKAELLPLASFCNAFQIPVNAFRIEGDPHDYPAEVCSMANSNDLSLLFFPLQVHSQFAQTLFWQTMKVVAVPTLLIAEMPSVVERDLSVLDTFSEGKARSRTNTFSMMVPDVEQSMSQPMSPTLYTTIPLEAVPMHRRRSVTSCVMKKPSLPKRHQVIAMVLLGIPTTDLMILSLVTRFAQNSTNEIIIYSPANVGSSSSKNVFPKMILDEIHSLQLKVEQKMFLGKVTFETFHATLQDYDALVSELSAQVNDLLVLSYVPPMEDPEMRLRSMSDSTMAMVAGDERIRARLVTGMPTTCAYSTLLYPELGVIGSRLYDCNRMHSSLLAIVHEPMRARKESTTAMDRSAAAATTTAMMQTTPSAVLLSMDHKSSENMVELVATRQEAMEILV